MKKYFLDDKGIDVIVKNIIKKLFESQNYINLRNSISSLRADLDKVSTSSNEVVLCRSTSSSSGCFRFSYPSGFNESNTMVVATYSNTLPNGSPGQFGIDYITFSFSGFVVYATPSPVIDGLSGTAYAYIMKRPSS